MRKSSHKVLEEITCNVDEEKESNYEQIEMFQKHKKFQDIFETMHKCTN